MSVANSGTGRTPSFVGDQPLSPTKTADQQIVLVDKTVTEAAQYNDDHAADGGERTPSLNRITSDPVLARRWTKSSLQQQIVQRKYARYQENRFVERTLPETQNEDDTTRNPQGTLEWGKGRVKALWRRKKMRQVQEEDAVIDILFENQRGVFTLGIPHFSSNSLLNFDPKPWTNAERRTSPVNITNAQVPDPNWEWAWKSWYVDMSRDVDEDGWEYSLHFTGFAWHGNHPWFHSFVRRRRWLRKRIRKHAHHAKGETPGQKHLSEAHMLTPEYFTIHPSRTRSMDQSRTPSIAPSWGGKLQAKKEEEDAEDRAEVRDIATLLTHLRRATIDREKLVLVRNFVSNASEELYYLQDQIPHIMSLFVFQNSRRQLLELLLDEFNAASAHRKKHVSEGKAEGPNEKRRIDNLLNAVQAADQEVKRLEYWSDIRKMVREGHSNGAVNDNTAWPPEEWQGLDTSGPLSNEESQAKEKGKSNPEVHEDMDTLERATSGKLGETFRDPEEEHQHHHESSAAEIQSSDAYETAAEVPVSIDKGKGRA